MSTAYLTLNTPGFVSLHHSVAALSDAAQAKVRELAELHASGLPDAVYFVEGARIEISTTVMLAFGGASYVTARVSL